jgi:hypothetical protein
LTRIFAGELTLTSTSAPLTNSGLGFETTVMDTGPDRATAGTGEATARSKLAATAHRSEFELIFTYLREPRPSAQSSPDGGTVPVADLGASSK